MSSTPEPERKYTIEIDHALALALRREARPREMTVPQLARSLLNVAAFSENLVHAILDDSF